MNLKNIHTDRLILIPITLEISSTLMNSSTIEIDKLGLKCHEHWPTKDTKDILPIINEALEKSKEATGFEAWMIIKKQSNTIIGDMGFFGPPDEKGEVEVGYGLVEEEWKKGFATEALKGIMSWLSPQKMVKIIKASCLINNTASAGVLKKCGFKEINRDAEAIYWEAVNGHK